MDPGAYPCALNTTRLLPEYKRILFVFTIEFVDT